MSIPPIETRYAGCRFRSRLEARWAVFFDALDMRWEYEPEGYRLGVAQKPYLPDFWLPDHRTLVEVKGDSAKLDLGLLAECLSLPDVAWVLILGPIPILEAGAVPTHSLLHEEVDFRRIEHDYEHWKDAPRDSDKELITSLAETLEEPAKSAVLRTWHRANRPTAMISAAAFVEGSRVFPMPITYPNLDHTPEKALNPLPSDYLVANPRIKAAYEAARSARFEHGESGALLPLKAGPAEPAAPSAPDATLDVFRDNWVAIVGDELAAHTEPVSFENGELVVSADSEAWAVQVRLLASAVVRRVNEELGDGAVQRVVARGQRRRRP